MNLVTEIRAGSCNGCGDCCKSGDPFNGTLGPPAIPGACPYLREQRPGYFRCADLTNPYWRNGCAIWPTEPAHTAPYPRCSFRWVTVG